MSHRRKRSGPRAIRQLIMARVMAAAMAGAPRLPAWTIDWIERFLAEAGPRLPILSASVRRNMQAAGVYTPQVHRAYFAGVAAHLAGGLHILRHSPCNLSEKQLSEQAATRRMPSSLAAVAAQRVRLDASFESLKEVAAQGKGVVLLAAHGINFLLGVALINQLVPVTIYSRWSDNARRRLAHRRWCYATGLPFIAEPASAADPARRAALMVEALQQSRVMVITPDLVQKRGEGVPVRLLGREIYLPAGPAALSLLSGAPMMTVMASPTPGGVCLDVHGPISAEVSQRKRGWRQAASQERMQWFAGLFENLLRQHPQLWFLWGDKRWTRMWEGDPRYSQPLEPESVLPAQSAGVA